MIWHCHVNAHLTSGQRSSANRLDAVPLLALCLRCAPFSSNNIGVEVHI